MTKIECRRRFNHIANWGLRKRSQTLTQRALLSFRSQNVEQLLLKGPYDLRAQLAHKCLQSPTCSWRRGTSRWLKSPPRRIWLNLFREWTISMWHQVPSDNSQLLIPQVKSTTMMQVLPVTTPARSLSFMMMVLTSTSALWVSSRPTVWASESCFSL